MKRIIGIVVVLGLSGLTMSAQKPVRESVIHIDTARPPADLSALYEQAHAVVRGKVSRQSTDVFQSNPEYPGMVITRSETVVVEALKRDSKMPAEGGRFTLITQGGEIDRGQYIERIRDVDFEGPKVGKEYVLFLRWNSAMQGYDTLYAANGVFGIDGDKLEAFGKASSTRALANRTAGAFMQELRRARER